MYYYDDSTGFCKLNGHGCSCIVVGTGTELTSSMTEIPVMMSHDCCSLAELTSSVTEIPVMICHDGCSPLLHV